MNKNVTQNFCERNQCELRYCIPSSIPPAACPPPLLLPPPTHTNDNYVYTDSYTSVNQ